MTLSFETYLAVGLTMAILSLWKTYSGPVIAALLSYSYPEMLVFNLFPALISAYFGWKIATVDMSLLKKRKKVVFKPKLRKFMKMWHQYGQLLMAILAPVLVGIPSYMFVSKRLNQSGLKAIGILTLAVLGWSSIAYGCIAYLDADQYVAIEKIIPTSVLKVVKQQ